MVTKSLSHPAFSFPLFSRNSIHQQITTSKEWKPNLQTLTVTGLYYSLLRVGRCSSVVEHLFRKEGVVCSIHISGSNFSLLDSLPLEDEIHPHYASKELYGLSAFINAHRHSPGMTGFTFWSSSPFEDDDGFAGIFTFRDLSINKHMRRRLPGSVLCELKNSNEKPANPVNI